MATTVVNDDPAGGAGDVVTGLASTVGALTNEAKHHAETLAAHAEKFTNVDEDTKWIKARLDSLEQTVTAVPSQAIADLRTEVQTDLADVRQQLAALSEAVVQMGPTDDPQTDPPAPAPNPAADPPQSGPLGGLRKALHRLL